MCVVVWMIRSCWRTEEGEERCFLGPGQSSDVKPGGHDEKGQGRTAFHKFMHIFRKVYFVGHTARASTAARFFFFFFFSSFCEFGFCYEVGLSRIADAG